MEACGVRLDGELGELGRFDGDDTIRACLRALLKEPASQKQLIERLAATQSAVSRALALLTAAGWVQADGSRGAVHRVRDPQGTRQLLLAADHLADALIRADAQEQDERTREDRRLLMNESGEEPGEGDTAGA